MSGWSPRWIGRVIHPNFYEAGVRRACVDFLSRKALKHQIACHKVLPDVQMPVKNYSLTKNNTPFYTTQNWYWIMGT